VVIKAEPSAENQRLTDPTKAVVSMDSLISGPARQVSTHQTGALAKPERAGRLVNRRRAAC
jgi:hypothetical protein